MKTPSLHPLALGALGALTCLCVLSGTAQAQDKSVITPKNANPNETYNLPPNFDPNYKPKRTPRNVKVTIDFRKAQLDEVVKFYSSMMKKNFIISDSLQTNKTITIISPKPVSIAEAYKAFLAALQMNGLTVVTMGSFLKIVESKKAIQEPIKPVGPKGYIPNDARVVTAIIPVDNANVDEIQQIVQKFLTNDATMITYGNSLIVTDNAANLRRIRNLVRRLDKSESTNRVFIYKVANAEAVEIQQKLNEIFGGAGAQNSTSNRNTSRSASRSRAKASTSEVSNTSGDELDVELNEIIADERTNQLLIVTNERSFKRIRQMIEILDVPTAVGGQIHVKFLNYANAEDLASTLSGLANSNTSSSRTRSTARPQRATPARGGASGQVAQLLQGDVQITSHKPTNSLIVVASPRDYLALERVIGLLDKPRRQVYVEAVIMEIGLDVESELGIGASGVLPADLSGVIPDQAVEDGLVDGTDGGIGYQANGGGGVLGKLASGAPGGALALLAPGLNIPGVNFSLPAFALFLQATQTDNTVNVLSTPSVMTMDNEEAEIVIADKVPISTGAGLGNIAGLANATGVGNQLPAGAAGLLGGFGGQNIQYEDVGITLRILPQINASSYVRLEVNQEVSDIKGAGGQNSQLTPTRTRRSVKTVVLVKDQSTIVIGGLIRDIENETEEKVPFLGDVPVLGILFKNTKRLKTKQNLVLMLTPYIIESQADLQKIVDRKRKEREELLNLFLKRDKNYMKSVNYDKKGGLVDRMRQQISGALEREEVRKEALKAFEDNGPRFRVLGEPTEVTPDTQALPAAVIQPPKDAKPAPVAPNEE